MKRIATIFLSLVLVLLPVAAFAQNESDAAAPAAFETNLKWESITYEGNDFEIRDDGLYTDQKTNTVFARSDKYVDGTVSFTMEYEADILSVVNNAYVQEEGWLYYTFGLGLPEGDGSTINDSVKGVLFYRSGVTIMPKTREGTYVIANTESGLPEELLDATHLSVEIEYAASKELLTYKVNGIELDADYFEPEVHEGFIGIETAWTEMLVTKAVYTEYPDGLPSEQKKATVEPQPTEVPYEPTDAPEVTEAVPAETEQPASDVPAATGGEKKSGDNKSGNPALWIILSVVAVIVIALIVILLLKKKKGAGRK